MVNLVFGPTTFDAIWHAARERDHMPDYPSIDAELDRINHRLANLALTVSTLQNGQDYQHLVNEAHDGHINDLLDHRADDIKAANTNTDMVNEWIDGLHGMLSSLISNIHGPFPPAYTEYEWNEAHEINFLESAAASAPSADSYLADYADGLRRAIASSFSTASCGCDWCQEDAG